MQTRHKKTKRRLVFENIASVVLMIITVFFAASALTALIISIEQVTVFVMKGRWINTYTNVYGNAWGVVLWHFLMIFLIISYWSLLEVFHPLVEPGSYPINQYLNEQNEDQ
ncbi:hypothetical protein H9L19_04575 [Weissella diestrammenae]|uniref:Uncharacterized protein n=2 Tax=Weissella diestrammenae TaxID=1162633 RepID=A0A7G9T7L4_9LACO|nr:hypothetical protein [Weissella diestrammenae]QNN76089.1 hypothetical protein H9L19_04575 [Weissella diestrammenae]